MAVPATVLYFTCYDQLRAVLSVRMGDYAQMAPLFAGALARGKLNTDAFFKRSYNFTRLRGGFLTMRSVVHPAWAFFRNIAYPLPQSSILKLFFLISPHPTVGAATVVSPVELIRTKLQAQKQSYRELTSCIKSAVQSEGWLSLWRGLGPTLLRDVPFSAMYWYNYELCKRRLCERYHTREPTFAISFASGALSGSVSVPIRVSMSLSAQGFVKYSSHSNGNSGGDVYFYIF